MKNKVSIDKETLNFIITTIISKISPEKIFLFGSYANGVPTNDSDLDILIVMDTKLPQYKRSAPIKLLFNPYPCPMDILVYIRDEFDGYRSVKNHIIHEVETTGKLLYEREIN